MPVGRLNVLLAVLAALTVALSMRIVGILLIAALMVLPVIAAARVAWSMRSTILLSTAIGLGSVLAGLTVAYYADLPPGGAIVLAAAGAFLVASAIEAVRVALAVFVVAALFAGPTFPAATPVVGRALFLLTPLRCLAPVFTRASLGAAVSLRHARIISRATDGY